MTRPLRIAVFAHEFPALSETFVLRHVLSLMDRGHDVVVLSNQPRDEPAAHDEITRRGVDRRVRYLAMPKRRERRALKAFFAFGRAAAAGPATPWRALDAVRYGREASSLRLLYWAATLAGSNRFDIIHCHFGQMGRLAAFLREIGALNGRLVTTFHGVDLSAVLRAEPSYYRHLLAAGDLFLAVSETWRRRLLNLGCDPWRAVVHHTGVDLSQFTFAPRVHSPQRPLRLLTIGRLIEKKGIEYGLEGAATLARRGVALRYDIVGDGCRRGALEAKAAALGIADRVRFLGWRDQEDVRRMLYENDVLLAPSVTAAEGDQEGIPVTIMEAMATGMPVIATWHSGIPELVEDQVSGLLVPERDGAALAAAVEKTLADGAWEKLGTAARLRIEAAYDARLLDDALERHYHALVEPKQGGSASDGPPVVL